MGSFRHGLALLVTVLLSLIPWAHACHRVRATGHTVRYNLTLTWEDWAPAGSSRKMVLTNGQFPGPTLNLHQGDDVEVTVVNQLPWGATIHFHGITQLHTPWSDGTPGISQKLIPPGGQFLYKWHANEYGSYWYHAHARGLVEDGLYGAISIQPHNSVERPFGLITEDKEAISAMRKAEKKTTPVILSDWRKLSFDQVWQVEEDTGLDAMCTNALLVNGKGSISCLGKEKLDSLLSTARKSVLGNVSLTDIGCMPPTITTLQGDFPHNISALPPSVFSGCTPSQGPTETFAVHPSSKYASFDLISAAGVTSLIFSIDEHPMYVYAVDGRYIEPLLVDAVTVYNGARYSVMVELNNPAGDYTVRVANHGLNQIVNTTAIMSYKGAHKAQKGSSTPSIGITGGVTADNYTILDEDSIVPFPVEVPSLKADATHILDVDRFNQSFRWTLGNTSYPLTLEESTDPMLFDPSSVDQDLSLRTRNGTWVDLIFRMSNPVQPPHPIHKHSNKAFVIGRGDGEWNYTSVAEAMEEIPENFNFDTPQIRDTFVSPAAAVGPSWMAIRYHVVNPGAFLLHCHIQVHQSGGMALALLDGVDEWPEVPEEYRGDSPGFQSERK